jgi:hypothetical protein
MTAASVLAGERLWSAEKGDAIAWLNSLPEASVDLVMGSPPYLDARTYGIDAVYNCREWIDWMLRVTAAAVRVSRGLVLWVVAGVQRQNCYWPGPEGLLYRWWEQGGECWAPCVWWKVDEDDGGTGIPGSGGNVPGKRWLRKDWEYVLCFKRAGNIPYDHPEEMGHAPIVAEVGGEMSNRTVDGLRVNGRVAADPWRTGNEPGIGGRHKDGRKKARKGRDVIDAPGGTNGDGTRGDNVLRPMPAIANPGNVLPLIVKARVGGGHMGHPLCHENEAPYPEELARFFIKCYSPPGGMVCDPFSGSGTTISEAVALGRRGIACDLRESQVELTRRRMAETPLPLKM